MRHTLRLLLKSPAFTVTAVLILGCGIGANTAIFSLIDSLLLKPLPYPRSDRLVEVFQPLRNIQKFYVCYPDYLDFCASQNSFQDLAATYNDDLVLTGQGEAAHLTATFVTGNYFRTLGRSMLVGQTLGQESDRADTPAVVVIGEHLWRSRFHADPNVVGTHIVLSGARYQVVGVTAQRSDETADLYLPLTFEPALDRLKLERANHGFRCFGRLKDGVTLQQAQADLEVTAENLRKRFPDTHSTVTVRIAPLLDSVVGDFTATLWLVGASVVLLLVIACANIAGLHLARGLERQREMTIRASLGASKVRLVREVLIETVILSILGGLAGFFLARWGVILIRLVAPSGIPRFDEIRFNNGAFCLVTLASIAISLFAGLFPALALAKTDLTSSLRSEGAVGGTNSRQRQRTQQGLIVCQVAFASLLLFGCVLLAHSFQMLQGAPLGFNPHGVLIADIYLPEAKYGTLEQCKTFFQNLVDKVTKLPGVKGAGLTDALPFSLDDNEGFAGPFGVTGQPEPDRGHRPRATLEMISPDYFRTLEIPILQGRGFDAVDALGGNRVVIVNRALADNYFPGQDPIGKQIHDFGEIVRGNRTSYTIIGVVPTIYQVAPAQQHINFQTYYPFGQPHPYRTANAGTLVVRTDGNPVGLMPAVQKVVAALDPDVPLSDSGTLEGLVAKSFETRRATVFTVALFTLFALTLSTVGVYTILARLVSLRTREIGIRIAIGAQIIDVVQIVLGQGIKIVCVGLILGIGSALILSQFLSSLLYGISSYDPVTIGFVIVALAIAAIVACLIPTVRAIRINPIIALRE
ncbi:MAG: ABC transporter permease [Verrucomicrobia bacterium]|nr:ABC transporter permease [Verrucomicrobiota bacterium]